MKDVSIYLNYKLKRKITETQQYLKWMPRDRTFQVHIMKININSTRDSEFNGKV